MRLCLAAVFACFALPAAALCSGESYLAQLDDDTRAAISAAAAAEPYGEGNIWRLVRDDKTLTIVGTMHVYDPRLNALRERVLPALADADLLLVEVTGEEELEMQKALAASPDLYLITDGPTLPDLLAPEVWDKVTAAAANRGLPGFMIAQMQPWYLSLTLGIPACAMADMGAGKRGLDHMLIADAAAADLPTASLESWEDLLALLSSSTMEEQLAALQVSLIDPLDQSALFVAMLDAYFSEQTATVWEIGAVAARNLTDLSDDEVEAQMLETQEVLLTQRNLNWIPVIEAAAAEHDKIVVAAGAAHLPGEIGILNLLAAEGWAVERLR